MNHDGNLKHARKIFSLKEKIKEDRAPKVLEKWCQAESKSIKVKRQERERERYWRWHGCNFDQLLLALESPWLFSFSLLSFFFNICTSRKKKEFKFAEKKAKRKGQTKRMQLTQVNEGTHELGACIYRLVPWAEEPDMWRFLSWVLTSVSSLKLPPDRGLSRKISIPVVILLDFLSRTNSLYIYIHNTK